MSYFKKVRSFLSYSGRIKTMTDVMPRNNHLLFIQYLRGIAALLVLFYHAGTIEQKYTNTHIFSVFDPLGMYGVDLFFVVSGFVISYASYDKLGNYSAIPRYLYNRFVRIYPIYWLVTLAVLIVYLLYPNIVNQSYQGAMPDILFSFLLLPGESLLLAVGWSLTYEVFFYAVFTIFFCFPKRCLPVLLLAWLAITIIFYSKIIYFTYYSFEFIAGAIIGYYYKLYDVKVIKLPVNNVLLTIGDASYSIYLTHILSLSLIGRIYAYLGISSIAAVIIMIIASLLIGILCHNLLEKPLYRRLKL